MNRTSLPLTQGSNERKSRLTDTFLFLATVAGVVTLLLVPLATWRRSEQYHREIDDVVAPISALADKAEDTARLARSIATAHYLGDEELYPEKFASSRAHFDSLVTTWIHFTEDDSVIRRAGEPTKSAWLAGRSDILKWFTTIGPRYWIRGGSLTRAEMLSANRLFRHGIDNFVIVRDIADRRQSNLREQIIGLNNREILVVAPMALICLAILALSWRNLLQARRARARLQVAIKETNHRVKNNLQVVSALIEMQEQDAPDPESRESLGSIAQQIKGMAAVHDLLSTGPSSELAAVDQLLRRVVELSGRSAGLNVSIETERALIGTKQATAVALIANELIINSFKHGAQRGSVRLSTAEGIAQLDVMDDGPGFPIGFTQSSDSNLGLGLVTTLVEHDLRGRIDYPSNGGSSIRITFPLAQA